MSCRDNQITAAIRPQIRWEYVIHPSILLNLPVIIRIKAEITPTKYNIMIIERSEFTFYTQTQKHLKPVDPMNIRTSSLLDHQNILIL
jgi:hypothetical protein